MFLFDTETFDWKVENAIETAPRPVTTAKAAALQRKPYTGRCSVIFLIQLMEVPG